MCVEGVAFPYVTAPGAWPKIINNKLCAIEHIGDTFCRLQFTHIPSHVTSNTCSSKLQHILDFCGFWIAIPSGRKKVGLPWNHPANPNTLFINSTSVVTSVSSQSGVTVDFENGQSEWAVCPELLGGHTALKLRWAVALSQPQYVGDKIMWKASGMGWCFVNLPFSQSRCSNAVSYILF